jgi:HK97 family phage major capsid protein/HK97 family phage prohead protease
MSEITAPEQRTVDVDVGALDTRGRTVHGYAALYDQVSDDLGGYKEKIAPGAFAGVLDADVRALLNHDPNEVLGRTKSGTLRLFDEPKGLRFELDLPDSPLGQNMRTAISRGDLDGASFRFEVGDESWEGDTRTVRSVKALHDVTLATYPAYPSTSIELRTKPTTKQEAPKMDNDIKDEAVEEAVLEPKAETRTNGTLRVEDRSAAGDANTEERVMRELGEQLRLVDKGESRALTGSISLAPTAVAATLFDRLRARAVMFRAGIRVLDMPNADSVVYPSITADVAPIFYSEGGTITAGDPTFSSITATPRKLAHLIQVSNEVLDDSTPPLQQVLNDHLLTVLGVKLDAMLLEGDGSAPNIRGLKNVAGIQTSVAGVNGASATLDMFADGLALLEAVNIPPENIVIVTHPRTVAALRKLKASTAGSYLWGDPTTATPRPIFGEQVFTTSQLSITETQGSSSVTNSAYLFDRTQVIWVRRQDPQVVLDRSRLFNSDQSELRATLRGDLIVPNPTAIVRITGLLP